MTKHSQINTSMQPIISSSFANFGGHPPKVLSCAFLLPYSLMRKRRNESNRLRNRLNWTVWSSSGRQSNRSPAAGGSGHHSISPSPLVSWKISKYVCPCKSYLFLPPHHPPTHTHISTLLYSTMYSCCASVYCILVHVCLVCVHVYVRKS